MGIGVMKNGNYRLPSGLDDSSLKKSIVDLQLCRLLFKARPYSMDGMREWLTEVRLNACLSVNRGRRRLFFDASFQ